MLIASSILLAALIVLSEYDLPHALIPVAVLTYLALRRQVLRKADWSLILSLTLMYLDFKALTQLEFLRRTIKMLLSSANHSDIFLSSLLLSQVISNVLATLVLIDYSSAWIPLAYGVNLGETAQP